VQEALGVEDLVAVWKEDFGSVGLKSLSQLYVTIIEGEQSAQMVPQMAAEEMLKSKK
jgi:hypothetical protein